MHSIRKMYNIVSYCRIRENEILRDDRVILSLPEISLDDFLLKAYEQLDINYAKFYKMDRMCKLGLLGSEVLLSGISKSLESESTSVILSNSSSSLDTDFRYWDSVKNVASPSLFVYTLPNIVAGEICIRNGFKGETNFFVSDAFEPDWLANNVEMVLSAEHTNSCLAGWVNVLGNHAEVFLYLTSKTSTGIGLNSGDNLRALFNHGSTHLKS